MTKTLLVADDDETFQRVVRRIFEGVNWLVETAEDGGKALEHISNRPPDVLLMDLHMPRMGGLELLAHIRGNPRLSGLPVIIISGDSARRQAGAEAGTGADGFISKPFDIADLVARVEDAARHDRRIPDSNQLTSLPGAPLIEEEASRRLKTGVPAAFFCVDIDNFKAYNDVYGRLNGDNAIKCIAGLLRDIQSDFMTEEMFVGHMGGDDFVVMAKPCKADAIARAIAARFDDIVPGFYNETDRARGGIVSKDRDGVAWEYPLMTLSIAITNNERRAIASYAMIVEINREMNRFLKNMANRFGSIYLKDGGEC